MAEDHPRLATTIATVLRREGMAADLAFDGQDALDHAAGASYDVIVLDRNLPRLHGDQVCRELLAGGCASRILMLTASGAVEDKVAGLSLGADDYLGKPFDFTELVARIRALARRSRPALPPVLAHGDLRVDPARRLASRAGRPLALSPKELAILELLLGAQGAVISAEEILDRVWDEFADPASTAVKTTLSRLRAKLGDPPVIQTVARSGYRI